MPPVLNHTVTVTIDGTDRTANLRQDSLFIRSNIGNTTDIAEFTIVDPGTFQILDWSEVTIDINGTRVFGGYITASSGTAVGDGPNKTTMWSIECRDWSALFDVTTVFYSFTDLADSSIIETLFDIYFFPENFDATTAVSQQYADVDVLFDHVTFREALDQLAGIVKAQWHLGPDKVFYWYAELDPDDAPFNIDTVSPDNVTSFDVLTNSLQATTDSLEIVNRLTVIGGWSTSGTKQVDVFPASSTETKYGPLTQPPSAMWSIHFIDSTDVERTAYASDIGIYPQQVTDDDGNPIYDSEREYIVTANLDTGYIQFDLSSISPATLKNGTDVTVQYYYKEAIEVTRDNTGSQGQYARVFHRYVFDESLSDLTSAARYADKVLAEFGDGRITVKFDVTRHGLLPGRLIVINTPAFNISTVLGGLFWSSDRGGYFLLENGSDRLALENTDSARKFLIQEVAIQTVVTGQNQFMIVARVSAGRWIRAVSDTQKKATTAQYKAGLRTGNRTYGSLSQVSGNLGEVVSGKALFTDGGTAQFSWTDYAGHTGAVVGLEDTGQPAPYGAAYILQDGTPRAKMGKMGSELPSVGTIVPDGWGIWTDNGYFSGVVSANAGQIGGWTLAANAIYANGGTISTGVPPINSSNPGVYMNAGGIFGYGTLGLTFSLPSDPAQRPIFSSGTILETVYEVTNASVIRTGTLFPKVQIDNSGIFAYNSGSVAKFSVDSSTGVMTAVDGVFSGSVTASQIAGGTITGGRINGGTISGGLFSAGTVSSAVFSGGTVTQGTISAATISGGTVSGGLISGGTVSGALVTGGTVSAVGGSVIFSDAGINFVNNDIYISGGSDRFLRWRAGSVSGSVTAYVGATRSGTINQLYSIVGDTSNAEVNYATQIVWGGNPNTYTTFHASSSEAYFNIAAGVVLTQPLKMTHGTVTVMHVQPSSNNFYSLGSGTLAFNNTYTRTLTAGTIVPISGSDVTVSGTIIPTAVTTSNIASTGNLTFAANGTNRIVYNHSNNSLEPSTDTGQKLGRSGMRWLEVWASNGAIQTSDEREKDNIKPSELGLDFISALEPISWTWREGDDQRTHHGLGAQSVERVADALGVDFGGIIHDAETDRYHLSYSEFIAPLIAATQELTKRIESLEARDAGRQQ